MSALLRDAPLSAPHRLLAREAMCAGMLRMLSEAWRDRLVVLAYHRIAEATAADFAGLRANVSATPEGFGRQLDLLQGWCNVVPLAAVVDWLERGTRLPPRAALITFDDGYRDNLLFAWPALKARSLPAVLFLATSCVGSAQPFWWDLVASAFASTSKTRADLPLLGACQLHDSASRDRVLGRWCDMAKKLPADAVPAAAQELLRRLGVVAPQGSMADLYLSLDEVRRLVSEGMAIGAHTVSHPALSRVSLARARTEARESKAWIERTTGQTVEAFAYPFGGSAHYLPEHGPMLAEEGFRVAFSLRSGPQSLSAVRRERMAVRRVTISHKDDLLRFAARLVGLERMHEFRGRGA
jgi:peptidoglycan/xylan/chitin deacetylase (PgdA/CDA1 family)